MKHGKSGTPEYDAWRKAIKRCYDPKLPMFKHYGARGIKVCDRWRNDFLAFLADMGYRPSPDLTLDRIDTDGDYEPGNCRWATVIEQMNNKRNNHILSNGKTLSQTAKELGIARTTIVERLANGWSEQEALRPARKYQGRVGESKNGSIG